LVGFFFAFGSVARITMRLIASLRLGNPGSLARQVLHFRVDQALFVLDRLDALRQGAKEGVRPGAGAKMSFWAGPKARKSTAWLATRSSGVAGLRAKCN
jgi:hypothetical protein